MEIAVSWLCLRHDVDVAKVALAGVMDIMLALRRAIDSRPFYHRQGFPSLKAPSHAQSKVERLDRMEVNVIHALGGFTRQSAGVVVVDVGGLPVGGVEGFQREMKARAGFPGELGQCQKRCLRPHSVVFNQGPGTEVTEAHGDLPFLCWTHIERD
jgi:hypothetical protein